MMQMKKIDIAAIEAAHVAVEDASSTQEDRTMQTLIVRPDYLQCSFFRLSAVDFSRSTGALLPHCARHALRPGSETGNVQQ